MDPRAAGPGIDGRGADRIRPKTRTLLAAYRLGANAFLIKPAEASNLEEMVKAIKDFWLTHNMPPQGS